MSKEAPAKEAPSLTDLTKKTIDILGRIIKKPPLTEKLLSKPPFRYLHDMFSELIKTTGFAMGLYDENESNSENVKEKDAKVAYLLKMIDVVGMVTGVEVKANPLKIVAGLDVEETNIFLQLLGKAILKKVDYPVDSKDAVKRVRAGEHQKKAGQKAAAPPAGKEKEKAPAPAGDKQGAPPGKGDAKANPKDVKAAAAAPTSDQQKQPQQGKPSAPDDAAAAAAKALSKSPKPDAKKLDKPGEQAKPPGSAQGTKGDAAKDGGHHPPASGSRSERGGDHGDGL
ncbi:TRAF3-interacting protein 1, partial [Irineochytrium annulatum]